MWSTHAVLAALCAELMEDSVVDQSKLDAFILSGKEPLMAFLGIVDAMTHLCFYNHFFAVHFDHKDVKVCKQEMFGSAKTVDRHYFFKKARKIIIYLDWMTDEFFNNMMTYLAECTNVEKIYVGTQYDMCEDINIELYKSRILSTVNKKPSKKLKLFNLDGTYLDVKQEIVASRRLDPQNEGESLFDLGSIDRHHKTRRVASTYLVVQVKLDMLRSMADELKLCPHPEKITNLTLNFDSTPTTANQLAGDMGRIISGIRGLFQNLEELVVDPGPFVCHFKEEEPIPTADEIKGSLSQLQDLLLNQREAYKITLILKQQFHVPLTSARNAFGYYVDDIYRKLRGYRRLGQGVGLRRFEKTVSWSRYGMRHELVFQSTDWTNLPSFNWPPSPEAAGVSTIQPKEPVQVYGPGKNYVIFPQDVLLDGENFLTIHNEEHVPRVIPHILSQKQKLVIDLDLDRLGSLVNLFKKYKTYESLSRLTLKLNPFVTTHDDLSPIIFHIIDAIRGLFTQLEELVIDPGALSSEHFLHMLPNQEGFRPSADDFHSPFLQLQDLFMDHGEAYKITVLLQYEYRMILARDEGIFEDYYYHLASGFLEYDHDYVNDNKFKISKIFNSTKLKIDVENWFVKNMI